MTNLIDHLSSYDLLTICEFRCFCKTIIFCVCVWATVRLVECVIRYRFNRGDEW